MPYTSPFRICLALLLCLSALFTACRKEEYTYPRKIDGTYNWHHTYNGKVIGTLVFSGGSDTTVHHPDETFDIKKKNKKQIEVKGQTLNFQFINEKKVVYAEASSTGEYHSLEYEKATGKITYYITANVPGADYNTRHTYTSY